MSDVSDTAERSPETFGGANGPAARGPSPLNTAAAVFLARNGASKAEILEHVEGRYGYDLHRSLDAIRPVYRFDVSCQGSVPEAIIAFLESDDYEDAVRKAVSLGGDSDTIACITGGIAEAFYRGVPDAIADEALSRLDAKLHGVVQQFRERYQRPAK